MITKQQLDGAILRYEVDNGVLPKGYVYLAEISLISSLRDPRICDSWQHFLEIYSDLMNILFRDSLDGAIQRYLVNSDNNKKPIYRDSKPAIFFPDLSRKLEINEDRMNMPLITENRDFYLEGRTPPNFSTSQKATLIKEKNKGSYFSLGPEVFYFDSI